MTTIIFAKGPQGSSSWIFRGTNILIVDDGSTRYQVGAIVFKMFEKVEHCGTVSGYDPVNKLYCIFYADDDTEVYYHNQVQDQQKRFLSKKKQWKKHNSAKINHLHSKYTKHKSNYVEHIMPLIYSFSNAYLQNYHTRCTY